jgi:two-component system osmolarity sensor histidine kinase EnvZ
VLLEGVVAFVFMERHWNAVTRRLSEATVRDIAALIDVYQDYSRNDDYGRLIVMARDRLNLSMQVLPPTDLPPAQPRPFFALLDRTLSAELRKQIKHPFWIDTVGNSRLVEVKVKLKTATLRFVATRSQTYASNSDIFMAYMVGSSVVLLTLAILFLRNRIRPILKLAGGRRIRQGRPIDRSSAHAARARCGRPRRRSARCANASRPMSSSARPCWPASATTCAPSSPASSCSSRCSATGRRSTR